MEKTNENCPDGVKTQRASTKAYEERPEELDRLKAEIEHFKTEKEQIKAELNREREAHIRALADFDDYRRRVGRERAAAIREAKLNLMRPLIEVMEDIERSLAHHSASPEMVNESLRAIHQRLSDLLEAEGAASFDSLGRPFDPARHEVIGEIEDDKERPGTVVDEVSRGWRCGADLLRPARVRIAR